MTLDELPTPCLVLDRPRLMANLARMSVAVRRTGAAFRPHLKTAKCIEIGRLATAGQAGGITVSTLAEAEAFARAGFRDIVYAVGITPAKLDRAAAMAGVLTLLTDDVPTAQRIAAHPAPLRALIEVDCGERRGGLPPDHPVLLAVADALGARCAGVLTHAGHSYAGVTRADMQAVAEAEIAAASEAAQLLRDHGHEAPIVSVGSSPTALAAEGVALVTEIRAGVYMFGDLFQAQIRTHEIEDIAVTVLASVIGINRTAGHALVDAGAIALSKDRSTQDRFDRGFGLVLDRAGQRLFPEAIVTRVYQEHGVVPLSEPLRGLRVGDRVRIAPNHTCLTAAQHDRYHVVDGGDQVVAVWHRINGW
jgi:D-serine deaminase-like pyridoxal phosphate-dependent protein